MARFLPDQTGRPQPLKIGAGAHAWPSTTKPESSLGGCRFPLLLAQQQTPVARNSGLTKSRKLS